MHLLRWIHSRFHRRINGEALLAGRHADELLRTARERTVEIDKTTRRAGELARRSDRFAREIERSWRPRRS